jgi:hypothetical protein
VAGPRASSRREPRKYHDAGAGLKRTVAGTERKAARLGESTEPDTSKGVPGRKLCVRKAKR